MRNAKYPPAFLVTKYREARAAIVRYLTSKNRKLLDLSTEIERLKDKASAEDSPSKSNDLQLSAEAIDQFLKFLQVTQKNPIISTEFEAISKPLDRILIENVQVSVNLDLKNTDVKTRKIGGSILQISKNVASKSWRYEHSGYVSCLASMQVQQSFAHDGTVDRKFCFSLDVFAKAFRIAPSNYKKRVNEIEAACREISIFWPSITPPRT